MASGKRVPERAARSMRRRWADMTGEHTYKVAMDEGRGDTKNIAVVGSGISGLACAWLLGSRHRVTLYEAADRLGGHTHTVDVPTASGPLPIDTGFIVYNEATYPNLTALFSHLGVATQASDMSFAVSLDGGQLEYAGTDLAGLFAQRRNLLRPRFLLMLRDLLRFYREAPGRIAELETVSLGAFLEREGYGQAFCDDHLLPMAAAIWSAPAERLRDFPAAAFVRFCDNHGLLKVSDRPIWRTVRGGARSYIDPLVAPVADRVRLSCGAIAARREGTGVTIHDTRGETLRYDHVVLATHADRALALLERPTAREREVLGAFAYSSNRAVLHADARLMPQRRKVWSSWNYIGRRGGELCVTYWMNKLQSLPDATDWFLTLNPARDPEGIVAETVYEHPIFDLGALAAQKRLASLQGEGNVWFCGAHFGAGFHEDGLQAGLAVAEALGGVRRPWRVPAESGRIYLAQDDESGTRTESRAA